MNASNCKCDKCHAVAHAIVGTSHRRCPGKKDAKVLAKRANRLQNPQRGVWQNP